MKQKLTPHIMTGMALAVFIALALACASAPAPLNKERILDPKFNKFKLELNFADKKVPIAEQCFLYLDERMVIRTGLVAAFSFAAADSVVVIPVDSKNEYHVLYYYYGYHNGSGRNYSLDLYINFSDQSSANTLLYHKEITGVRKLEAGKSYLLSSPYRTGDNYNFMMTLLDESGIANYTKVVWDNTDSLGRNLGSRKDWSSYEEYREHVTKMWQVRIEETKKQIK